MTLQIIIADDHAVVRKGLKQIITEQLLDAQVCEVTSAEEVLEEIGKRKFDLVISDISMQGRSGIDLAKQLKVDHPQIPVLILSIHPEKQYALRAFKAGAAGYLNKSSASEELVKAIDQITRGKKYVSPLLAELLADNLTGDYTTNSHEVLSDREFEVLIMLANGKTLPEISDLLSISVSTVSTYRSRILEKMKLETNAQLIHYAISNHLI